MKKNTEKILLVVIIAVGFFLRFAYLDKFPPSVSWDEISHGYNAYSILKTTRDEWGVWFPLSNFRAYGDYPLALNLYLTIPSIALFGLTEFSIRFPHVLLGTLTIAASYYLAKSLTKSIEISLLTALLVALEPWHFFFSRFAAQSNLSVFFLTLSFALFFFRNKIRFFLPLSVLSLGLTLYSYHTTRIYSPLILAAAVIFYKKDLTNLLSADFVVKKLTYLVLIILFFPLPFILLSPESRARSSEVFLINQGVVNSIIEKRQTSEYPEVLERLLYNRPVYFVTTAFRNHLEYFSPKFLFFKGGTHYQFSIPGWGLLYLVNLPFFYIGLYLILRKALNREKNFMFILVIFLLAPIPGSITKEHYAVMRATTMLPWVQIFTSIGFFYIYEKFKKFSPSAVLPLIFILAYLFVLLLNTKSYLKEYFGHYTTTYSQDRQYGYKEVVNYIKSVYSYYDEIVITKKYGEPHEFVLFFWPWDPESYRNDPNLVRFFQSNWYWVDSFDKFYFINDWQVNEEGTDNYKFKLESGGTVLCPVESVRCLLITSPGNYPSGWRKVGEKKFLDGSTAFEILSNN